MRYLGLTTDEAYKYAAAVYATFILFVFLKTTCHLWVIFGVRGEFSLCCKQTPEFYVML